MEESTIEGRCQRIQDLGLSIWLSILRRVIINAWVLTIDQVGQVL